MSSSFSHSSHGTRWLYASTDAANSGDRTGPEALTRDEVLAVKINYINLLHALGKQLRLRQTVTATAMLYFWRFYLHNSFSSHSRDEHNSFPVYHPDFVAPTCLSLACKVEECPLPERGVLQAALEKIRLDANGTIKFGLLLDEGILKKILENEFLLLDALKCDVVVFHPYADVSTFVQSCAEKAGFSNSEANECLKLTWNITNDSYRCDACLRFAPFTIALAALYVALTRLALMDKAEDWWVSGVNCELPLVQAAVDYIVSRTYGPWALVDVKHVEAILEKITRK